MDKNDLILSLRKEVTALRAQGKYKETIEKAYILLEEGTKFKDYKSILIAYVNIIASYYCIGDIEEAFQVLDKFKILCDEHGDDEDRLSLFNTSFLLYDYAKNYNKAKEIVESYDDVYLLKQIQEERCSLCDILNDTSLGYKVQKEYIDLLQEINKRELDKTALKLEIKHKVIDITKKASTDYLTGLYNRSYLETTANKWLMEADEKGERIICIAFDVDNFKGINDSFGHNFGDKILKEIGKLCLKLIPSPNIVCRYGGDEFVIILKNASLEEGKLKVKEISQEVRKLNICKNGKCVNVTLSIGMSDNLSTKAKRFDDLFHKADIKLYKAKRMGKDTYVFQI